MSSNKKLRPFALNVRNLRKSRRRDKLIGCLLSWALAGHLMVLIALDRAIKVRILMKGPKKKMMLSR